MPVQLNSVNSIITAYTKGLGIAKERQDEQTRQKEKADAIKAEQDRFNQLHDEAQKQQELVNKREEAVMKAQQAMQQATLTHNKLQTQVELTKAAQEGNLPPQYQPTGNVSGSVPISEGYATTRSEYASPNAGEPPIQALSPEDAIRQQEEIKRKALEPAFQNQLQLKVIEEASKQQAAQDLAKNRIDVANINAASRLAAAQKRGTQSQVTNQALRISNSFDSNDITKAYNVIRAASETVNNIPNTTKNPGDDQQLIYAFAKVMDPASVVREGEYNTVQRYSQSMADRLGFAVERINSNAPFLTPEARKQIKDTINNRAKIQDAEYRNLRNEAGKRIQQLGEQPENWLTEFAPKTSGTPQVKSGPKVGDTVSIGGKKVTIKHIYPDGTFD